MRIVLNAPDTVDPTLRLIERHHHMHEAWCLHWALTRPHGARALWWAACGAMAAKWSLMALLIGAFGWGAQAVAAGVSAATVGYALVLIPFVRRAFYARD